MSTRRAFLQLELSACCASLVRIGGHDKLTETTESRNHDFEHCAGLMYEGRFGRYWIGSSVQNGMTGAEFREFVAPALFPYLRAEMQRHIEHRDANGVWPEFALVLVPEIPVPPREQRDTRYRRIATS